MAAVSRGGGYGKMGKLKRKNITGELTREQIEDLMFKDFLGQLEDHEIPIAQKYGLYKWDLYVKERDNRIGRRTARVPKPKPLTRGEPRPGNTD